MAPNTDIATRALIVAFKSPIGGKSTKDIADLTRIPERTINSIYARAIERGFDPNVLPLVLKDTHLEDAPRTGRPKKQTQDLITTVEAKVRQDRYGREKTCADIAGELYSDGFIISETTI